MTRIEQIRSLASCYESDMVTFLRDLIRIPGEGQQEGDVVKRICQEMQKLNFDNIQIDSMGNILGFMGHGDNIIAFDGHIDTVGPGALENWNFDPYEGFEDFTWIGGRGASDQLGGIVSAIYGVKIAQRLALIPEDYQLLVVGSVQEEECEGLNWQYIIEENKLRPSCVILTEPTDGHVYRGHRGRADILIEVKGISAHGSTPDKGSNAICHMAEIIRDLESLAPMLHEDTFLGKGTLAITQIFFESPSRCAIPDKCLISIDRRLTAGETIQSAIQEISSLPSVQKYNASIRLDHYARRSWKNYLCETDCYFPVWQIAEESSVCQAVCNAVSQFYESPFIDKWVFSTNGVSIAGKYQIPCIGYGPGIESQAHAPNEKMPKKDLTRCASVYALIPDCIKTANKL